MLCWSTFSVSSQKLNFVPQEPKSPHATELVGKSPPRRGDTVLFPVLQGSVPLHGAVLPLTHRHPPHRA